MPRERPKYHHGDLRAALVRAADEIIAEAGIEGFSLRAAAARAGVSPGAPAHHFGSAKGLLTEVAALAFERSGQAIEEAGRSGEPAADLRALGLAFVRFALENPGHFRLMFRNDLIDRNSPRYREASNEPGMRLDRAIAAYQGRPERDPKDFEDAVDTFGVLATLQGIANLVVADKLGHLFGNVAPQEFLERDLPRVLERLYPNP